MAYVIGDVTVKNVAVEIISVVAKLRDRRWTGAVASSVHCGVVWCGAVSWGWIGS